MVLSDGLAVISLGALMAGQAVASLVVEAGAPDAMVAVGARGGWDGSSAWNRVVPPARLPGSGDLCGYVMDRSAYTLFRALLLGSSERDSAHEAASMG